MMDTSSRFVFSIYRTYLREVRRLPHIYLRQFYQIYGSDNFRALLNTKSENMRCIKLKRIVKGLRRLQSANVGNHMAFNNMLDVAYGRVGKLRYELMQSLLSAPDTPLPPPVIPGKDKSRPPVYSHELRALLMSSFARKNPLKARDLFSPPILPARAKPGSADAILLGPLSKRREANIRRRYFTTEWKKVLPPLQISVEPSCSDRNSKPDVASPRDIGFEQTNVLQQVLDLAGGCFLSPRPTRREHKFHIDAVPPCSNPFDGNLPTRWLRRRYRELLGRLPLLTCQPEQSVHQGYAISVSKNALIGGKWQASRLRFVDEDDQAWLQDMRGLQRSAIL